MKTSNGLLLTACTLGAFFGGYALNGTLTGEPAGRTQMPEHGRSEREPDARAPKPEDRLANPRSAASGSEAGSRTDGANDRSLGRTSGATLFSDVLLAHHREQFVQGWTEVRDDLPNGDDETKGEAEFKERTLALSAVLGGNAADERDEKESLGQALATNDGAALLAAADLGLWSPTKEYVDSPEFEAVTEARARGGTAVGEDYIRRGEPGLDTGMTLTFGAGIHRLAESMLRGADRRSIPSDITIVGAGRYATLLQIGDLGSSGNIERLTFKALTIDAMNDGMFDHRSGSMTLTFTNARIIRFDAGHGGCSIFSSRGGTIVNANNLDVIGGYGRSPGSGELIRGEPFVGRFRNCRFELVELDSLVRLRRGRVDFEGCSFVLQQDDPRVRSASAPIGFTSCSFVRVEGERADLQKSIADLFPEAR